MIPNGNVLIAKLRSTGNKRCFRRLRKKRKIPGHCVSRDWLRSVADSNRRKRFCRPLPSHSVNRPLISFLKRTNKSLVCKNNKICFIKDIVVVIIMLNIFVYLIFNSLNSESIASKAENDNPFAGRFPLPYRVGSV